MTSEQLFAMGLGLSSPWTVTSSDIVEGELHIKIDFEKGARFDGLAVHDTVERTWRHLNFWQFPTYLHARVPRVETEDGKVVQVEVPWGRPGSGFTALFEALALTMARAMPISAVSKQLEIDDMVLWRLVERSVQSARAMCDFSGVRRVGVDETSCKKGHDYISVFVDLDAKRVLFVTRGKGASTLGAFKRDLLAHGGKPNQVRTFSCDMSQAFLSGVCEHFPKAQVVLDKFHLVKMISEAVDETRRSETKGAGAQRGTRFLWLKNPNNLSDAQTAELGDLLGRSAFAKTAEAYRLRLAFQEMFKLPARLASDYLAAWLDAALESGVQAVEKVGETFFKMRDHILAWFKERVVGGILEGLNSVLQSAKNRARGYANPDHMILMSYLLHGKLDLTPQAIRNIGRRRLSTAPTHSM